MLNQYWLLKELTNVLHLLISSSSSRHSLVILGSYKEFSTQEDKWTGASVWCNKSSKKTHFKIWDHIKKGKCVQFHTDQYVRTSRLDRNRTRATHSDSLGDPPAKGEGRNCVDMWHVKRRDYCGNGSRSSSIETPSDTQRAGSSLDLRGVL